MSNLPNGISKLAKNVAPAIERTIPRRVLWLSCLFLELMQSCIGKRKMQRDDINFEREAK